jgi:hypothetical protein
MKTTPNNMISTHLEREGATTIVLWENHPKRKVHIIKQKLTLRDYKRNINTAPQTSWPE